MEREKEKRGNENVGEVHIASYYCLDSTWPVGLPW